MNIIASIYEIFSSETEAILLIKIHMVQTCHGGYPNIYIMLAEMSNANERGVGQVFGLQGITKKLCLVHSLDHHG